MDATEAGAEGVASGAAGKIMLEVAPPSKRASAESIAASVEKIAAEVNGLACIDCINVPEIIEENREGAPYYRNIDTRIFGKMLFEKTGKRIVANKVVAHLSEPQLGGWLGEAISEYRISDVVFVGASRGSVIHVGPSIVEANRYAASLPGCGNLEIGNILIPERENEVQRAVSKTQSGCSFFTTQIIFRPESFNRFVKEYHEECRKRNLKSSRFFLSFAPAKNAEDVEFFRWLGCDMAPAVVRRFEKSSDVGKTSMEIARKSLLDILIFMDENRICVPVGINVEAIFLQNLPLAIEMIKSFQHLIKL